MLGLLVTEKEAKELEYLLKREMDEIYEDIDIERLHPIVKRAVEERYKILYQLFRKIGPQAEWIRYYPQSKKAENKFNKKR